MNDVAINGIGQALAFDDGAIREQDEFYRCLFEQLNDAAFLADVETGVILDANLQAETLLGRRRDEIIGMHQSQLHPAGKAEG